MDINPVASGNIKSQAARTGTLPIATGKVLPSGKDGVDISLAGKARLNQTAGNIQQSSSTPTLVTGHDALIGLGMVALGGEVQLDKWREQGLEITEDTLLMAAKTFQEGMKSVFEQVSPTSAGLSLNRYQIVTDAQDTPEWFGDEYRGNLLMMDDPKVRNAFAQGESYYLSLRNSVEIKAINQYEST